MGSDEVINFSISLLTTISILVVISLGLAVIFGMMGVINLAHGEFLMLGAFLSLTASRLGLNFPLSVLVGAIGVGLFGLVVERVLIRFLYGRLAATMLATWGLSLIMVQGVVFIFGPSTQGIPTPLGSISIGRYSFAQYSLVLIGAAVTLSVVVYLVFKRTRYGVNARAATQLPLMAAAVGVNSRRTNMYTFAFGSLLAGCAGALIAPFAGVFPGMGQVFVGRAFMTVVVGGPAVLTGTVASSGLLGTVDSVVSNVLTPFIGTAALLLVAIVLLRFLPTGISGRMRVSL